jgi:hypothetical protein
MTPEQREEFIQGIADNFNDWVIDFMSFGDFMLCFTQCIMGGYDQYNRFLYNIEGFSPVWFNIFVMMLFSVITLTVVRQLVRPH